VEFVGVGFGGVKTRRVRYDTRMMAGKRNRVGMSERITIVINLQQSTQTLIICYLKREEA